jgi:hypothetical protein
MTLSPKNENTETADTTGFSRVVFQFQAREQNSRFLDTIDFSRMEVST